MQKLCMITTIIRHPWMIMLIPIIKGTSASGYESKRNELKQFFSRTKKFDEEQIGEQE